MSPPASHTACAAAGPAPVLPGVPLLLTLLSPQEEQSIVRQQDSETRKQGVNLSICKILTVSTCGAVFISAKVSFPINWVTSRNVGTLDNQIVLCDAFWTRDRDNISYWDSDIPGDKQKLNTETWTPAKWNLGKSDHKILPPAASVYLHLFDFLYMFMSVWLSNRGIGQLKWKSFDIEIELFMGTLQLRYSEMADGCVW